MVCIFYRYPKWFFSFQVIFPPHHVAWEILVPCHWVTKSCTTFCDPLDCSMPGFPVLHYLPEFAQTHVHWVGDAIQPSHTLCHPLLLPSIFPSIRVFSVSQLFASGGQSTGVSALASFLQKKSQGLSPSEWTGWISLLSKGLSRASPTPQFKSINSSVLSFLYGPTLPSIHDYWKNHSLD